MTSRTSRNVFYAHHLNFSNFRTKAKNVEAWKMLSQILIFLCVYTRQNIFTALICAQQKFFGIFKSFLSASNMKAHEHFGRKILIIQENEIP